MNSLLVLLSLLASGSAAVPTFQNENLIEAYDIISGNIYEKTVESNRFLGSDFCAASVKILSGIKEILNLSEQKETKDSVLNLTDSDQRLVKVELTLTTELLKYFKTWIESDGQKNQYYTTDIGKITYIQTELQQISNFRRLIMGLPAKVLYNN